MSEPDILRIVREGDDEQLTELYQRVQDERLKLIDVANEHDYLAIKSSEVFSRLPQEERRLFESSISFQDFLLQFDAIFNKKLPAYFVTSTATSTSKIGVQIQSVSDVAVQETSFVDSVPYVRELERVLTRIEENRVDVDAQVERELNSLRTTTSTYLQDAREQIEQLSSRLAFVASFDVLIRNQLRYDAMSLGESRLLTDNLYTMYLTRESPQLRRESILRRRPGREPLNAEDLRSPTHELSFHDVIGRRLLILSSPEEFDRENTMVNQVIVDRGVPRDFLASCYGYSNVYSSFDGLFADLLEMVQSFCDKYKVSRYDRYQSMYIDDIAEAGILPLIVDQRSLPANDRTVINDLTELRRLPINRRRVAAAYRRLIIDGGVVNYGRQFFTFLTSIYPSITRDALRTGNLLSTENLLKSVVLKLTSERQLYRQSLSNLGEFTGVRAHSIILMCRAQTDGFFKLLGNRLTFEGMLAFLRSKDDLMGNLGGSYEEYTDYADTQTSRTSYRPLMFINSSMDMTSALRAIYAYHLLSAIYDLQPTPMTATKQSFLFQESGRPQNVEEREREIYTLAQNTLIKQTSFDALQRWSAANNAYSFTRDFPVININARSVLGNLTKTSQGYVFWNPLLTDEQNANRFYELFGLLMLYHKTFAPSTVLLYLYLRFTETRRGVDRTFSDRTFETWVTMISHQRAIETGEQEDPIGHRVDDDTDYQREKHQREISVDASTQVSEELYRNIFRNSKLRNRYSYEGALWCQRDIFARVPDSNIRDQLVNALTMNNTIADVLDMQLHVLESIPLNLRRSVLSVLVHECSYVTGTMETNVPWVSMKRLLWELHPETLTQTILSILHFTAPYNPETTQYTLYSYGPVVATIAPLRSRYIEAGVFDPRAWIKDVKYTNADHYINSVHINQIMAFDKVIVPFESTTRGASSIAVALNIYTQRVDSHFFDIWLDVFPADFFSSQIDRFIGGLFTAYNQNAEKIMPPSSVLDRTLPLEIYHPFIVKSTPELRSSEFLSNVYDFEPLNNYSINVYLQLLALLCRANTLLNKQEVRGFLDQPPSLERTRTYQGDDKVYFADVHAFFRENGELFEAFMKFLRVILTDNDRMRQLLAFTKSTREEATIFAIRQTMMIATHKLAEDFVREHATPPTYDIVADNLLAYETAMKTINQGQIVLTSGTPARYHLKQLLAELTKQLFTTGVNLTDDDFKAFDVLVEDYRTLFIVGSASLSEQFNGFLEDHRTQVAAIYSIFDYLRSSHDAQLVQQQLSAISSALRSIHILYHAMIGSVVQLARGVCERVDSKVDCLQFFVSLVNARSIKVVLFYLNRDVLPESTPSDIAFLINAATSTDSLLLQNVFYDIAHRASKDELDVRIGLISLFFAYPNHDENLIYNARRSEHMELKKEVADFVDVIVSLPSIVAITSYLFDYADTLMQSTIPYKTQVLIVEIVNVYYRLISNPTFVSDLYNNEGVIRDMRGIAEFSDEDFQKRIHQEVIVSLRDYIGTNLLLRKSTNLTRPVFLYGNSLTRWTIYRNTLELIVDKVNV